MAAHDHLLMFNVTLLNITIVCTVVIIHNEALLRLSSILSRMR